MPGRASVGASQFLRGLLGSEAPATRIIIGLSLIVFALSFASERSLPIFDGQFKDSTLLRFGAILSPIDGVEPWRYLSAIFVHANVVHVGLNLFWFTRVGGAAEQEFGSARFIVLCLLSGALGFVACDGWAALMGVPTLVVGASGLVFGAFGSVVGVRYARRDPSWKDALTQNIMFIVISSLMGRVSTPAHVGGFVVGVGLGFLFAKLPNDRRLSPLFGALSALLLLGAVAGIVLSALSPVWRAFSGQS